MTFAQVVQLAIPISLTLIVMALGMRCTYDQATSLFRQPGLLIRSVLAMNVVLPIVAIALVAVTPLNLAVKVALIALALAPVPPILPNKQLKLVTHESYVYGLLVATSVLSIIIIPITMAVIARVFGREAHIAPMLVARTILTSVLVPLAIGMLVRHLWPAFASRANPFVSAVGSVLLAVALLLVLIAGWRAFASLIGDGTLVTFAAVALIGLAVGHLFGGPNPDHRTALALACASRHPGVAVAIGGVLFPGEKLVAVAVLLYLLVGAVVSIPYHSWRKRVHERMLVTGAPTPRASPRP
ncbi:MAG: Na+-dependent transporter [Gammaproteobacteria bacterium]